MSGNNIIFDDKKNKKINFYKNKKLTQMENVDVKKIIVSTKIPCRTKNSCKYLIEYNDDADIRPLHIKLPQMIGCAKYFGTNKTTSFKVIDKNVKKIY